MKNYIVYLFFIAVAVSANAQALLDEAATVETRKLYSNMIGLSKTGFMLGHHEDMAYGTSWNAIEGRSDIKDVCGSYPAVHGWDVGRESGALNIDNVSFAKMHQWIKGVYDRGGINTISWHVDNPVTGGGAWDTLSAVNQILPGGKYHEVFVKKLDYVATFLKACKSGDTYIPIIFRPFHEHNGNWFWWGKGHCTEQEFVELWKFTVGYLKNEKGLHHLIYAFSPDRSRMILNKAKASYLYAYPGDDYVDVLGLDDYMDVGISSNGKSMEMQQLDFIQVLQTITSLANDKKKLSAVTETGLEGVTNAKWFTSVILNPVKKTPDIHISYIMLWRNANTKHHYATYPGHTSENDFKEFYADKMTLFEVDLNDIYHADVH